jgi:hypothetical protein
MLSDKYLWPVPELTPVHEVYKLTLFQEPVTVTLLQISTFSTFSNFWLMSHKNSCTKCTLIACVPISTVNILL